jgi:hypothetical protein
MERQQMTETEQEFYKIFEIEKLQHIDQVPYKTAGIRVYEAYPPITAEFREKLIEIIIEKYGDFAYSKLHNPIDNSTTYQAMSSFEWEDWNKKSDNAESIEEALLSLCIKLVKQIKSKVRKLFK